MMFLDMALSLGVLTFFLLFLFFLYFHPYLRESKKSVGCEPYRYTTTSGVIFEFQERHYFAHQEEMEKRIERILGDWSSYRKSFGKEDSNPLKGCRVLVSSRKPVVMYKGRRMSLECYSDVYKKISYFYGPTLLRADNLKMELNFQIAHFFFGASTEAKDIALMKKYGVIE